MMSAGQVDRETLYRLNEERLGQLAHRALSRGLGPQDFVIVCIDMDDPSWCDVGEHLMPGHDWDAYRVRGERPIARGSVMKGFSDYIAEVVPAVASAIRQPLPEGECSHLCWPLVEPMLGILSR